MVFVDSVFKVIEVGFDVGICIIVDVLDSICNLFDVCCNFVGVCYDFI